MARAALLADEAIDRVAGNLGVPRDELEIQYRKSRYMRQAKIAARVLGQSRTIRVQPE